MKPSKEREVIIMTRKKKLAIIISTVIIVIAIIGVSVFSYASEVTKKNSIGIDKALNIAMIDAGVHEEDVVVTKAEMDFDKGVFVYDIEFDANGIDEYEYSIKASDGTILFKDHELDDDEEVVATKAKEQTTQAQSTTVQNTTTTKAQPQSTTASTASETTKASSSISLDDAKAIAFKHSGVSKNDAVITSAHKDTDDGITYYEIEFETSSYEYEYEIDLNGKIISYDRDKLSTKHTTTKATTTASSSNAKYIGVDRAKEIALGNAGLSAKSVVFTKAKYERDDGVSQYEIEFKTSTTEYEYEINAVTGKIISRSSEPIDD